MTIQRSPAEEQINSQIKRNTILLATNNLLMSCLSVFILTVSPIIIYDYTKSIALASLATSLILSVRMPANFPAGKLADTIGRKKTLLIGVVINFAGIFLAIISRITDNIWLFWTGIIIYGLGVGFFVLNRAAMTDMYPGNSGKSLGYLNMGGFLGSILAPILVSVVTAYSTLAILSEMNYYDILILLCVPLILLSGMLLLAMPQDTMAIAKILAAKEERNTEKSDQGIVVTPNYRRNLAFAIVTSSIAVGGVSIGLSISPTLMHISNAELWVISFSLALISFGSSGLSILSGILSDKLGKKKIILMGCIIMAVGLFLLPITKNVIVISISNFLIGFGGGAMAIASTTMICDLVVPHKRGKMFGLNSTVITVFTLLLPPLAAALFTIYGPISVSILGLTISGSALLGTLFIINKRE